MVNLIRTEDFNPKFEVAGCFVEFENKILLLHRQDNDTHGGKWGLPAGKVNTSKHPQSAAIRELQEETDIRVSVSDIKFINTTFNKGKDADYIFHAFKIKLNSIPIVKISTVEHQDYGWYSPNEILGLNFIEDLDTYISVYYLH